MKFPTAILTSLFLTFVTFAEESIRPITLEEVIKLEGGSSKNMIIHVPQSHDATHLGNNDSVTPLRSQFQIAQFFLALTRSGIKPKIWMEGVSADNAYFDKRAIRKAFPKGFPESEKNLTQLQKAQLLKWGAPGILYGLGKIEKVYGAENALLNLVVLNKVVAKAQETGWSACEVVERTVAGPTSKLKTGLTTDREKVALELIADVAPENSVSYLVYGGDHDFTQYGPNIYRLKLE